MPADRRNIFTFDDARRVAAPPVFASMAKPVGSACNLDCDYCYYLGKSHTRKIAPMPDRVLEEYVRQYIECNAARVVSFCWHGGEPLLAGKAFFARALELQRRYGAGRQIENTVQTNGLLLDREWCDMFRRNAFLVGISLDGPQDIHDAHRRDMNGAGTWRRVMDAVRLMLDEGVEFNTMSVVSRAAEGRGAEVYGFLKSAGSRFMQFLPAAEDVLPGGEGKRDVIVPPGTVGAARASWSVTGEGYGRFMTDVFDEWVREDVGRCFVPFFDAVLARYVGLTPALCTLGQTCGQAVAVERNGDVFSCDHFVFPTYRLGNVEKGDLAAMVRSGGQMRFGMAKRNSLPGECARCRWVQACGGGCPKHRLDMTKTGEAGLNSLCEGYKLFFEHAHPAMEYMAARLAAGEPPAMVTDWIKTQDI